MSLFGKCPGADKIRQPKPEDIICACGKEIEIWSDEMRVTCPYCRKKVERKMFTTSCLDWCSKARECVGEEKYKKYQESKREHYKDNG